VNAVQDNQSNKTLGSYPPIGKLTADQGDKIVSTDKHIIIMPPPERPVPTPTPMPFAGKQISGLSTDVFIEGKLAATAQA